jgi:hypothetical protein
MRQLNHETTIQSVEWDASRSSLIEQNMTTIARLEEQGRRQRQVRVSLIVFI